MSTAKTPAIQQALADCAATIARAKAATAAIRKNATAIRAAIEHIPTNDTASHSYLSVIAESHGDHQISIHANFYIRTAGFGTDTPFYQFLCDIVRAGYRPTGNHEYASEYSAERTFNYERVSGASLEIKTTLSVTGRLIESAENATCRRVLIGTETREVPKYAIVCD